MPSDLTCRFCQKRTLSYGGMTKHVRSCRKNPVKQLHSLRHSALKAHCRLRGEQRNPLSVISLNTAPYYTPQRAQHQEQQTSQLNTDSSGHIRITHGRHLTQDVGDDPAAEPLLGDAHLPYPTIDADATGNMSSSSTSARYSGLLSATSLQSLHQVHYVYENEEGAGTSRGSYQSTTSDYSNPATYGFRSHFDYAFASWLHRIKCTQGDVDRLFDDQRMSELHNMLSFSSGKSWTARLEGIPYGIAGCGFQSVPVDVKSDYSDVPPAKTELVGRNAAEIVRFLIGHKPFKDALHYAPTKLFRDETREIRVYNELYTGNWWWETQEKLPPGSTVVPVLISVDKTLMTMLHGDTVCWPVYLTIGNLDRDVRRAHDRCGIILLGFVPVLDCGKGSGREGAKFELYHTAMTYLLRPLEKLAVDGEEMKCADGQIRLCYPILCGFIADYQEQTLITGVKNNTHCTICKVPPDMRGELLKGPWDFRTHEDTQQQIEKQRRSRVNKGQDDWVHDISCFAWRHKHFNIHEGMLVDTLHQLLKGLVMYTMKWLQQLIGDVIPKTRIRKGQDTVLTDQGGKALLDQRFKEIPIYTRLRRFTRVDFSRVTQWTGDEQKAIIQQLVAVITPILCEREPYAIHFTKAVCDFVTIAQYRTHDDDTLAYLDDALRRINALKHLFESFRPRRKDNPSTGHFNIPKLHSLTHWNYFIKSRGSPDGYDTGPNGEAPHNFLLKEVYKLTNKKDFLMQLGRLNNRMIAVLALESLFVMESSCVTTEATRQFDDMQVTTVGYAMQIRHLGWGIGWTIKKQNGRTQKSPAQTGTWIHINEAAKLSGIADLVDIIAVFVRNQRARCTVDHSTNVNHDQEDEQVDIEPPAWIRHAMLQIHPSIRCWYRNGKHPTDTEQTARQLVRCQPWGRDRQWRKDYVVASEFGHRAKPSPNPEDERERLYGKTVGQVELIFTVRIEDANDSNGPDTITYTGAVLNRLSPINHSRPHLVHGMIELEYRTILAPTARMTLGSRKAFSMPTIWRGIHVVPAHAGSSIVYINNYVDFELYNELYSPTFEEDSQKVISSFGRYWKRRTKGKPIPAQQHAATAATNITTTRRRGRPRLDELAKTAGNKTVGRVQATRVRPRRVRPIIDSDEDKLATEDEETGGDCCEASGLT